MEKVLRTRRTTTEAKIEVRRREGYISFDDLEGNADEAIQKFASIINSHRSTSDQKLILASKIEYGYYDTPGHEILEIFSTRLETDTEFQARLSSKAYAEEMERKRDLEQLACLKKKYEDDK